MLHGGRGRFVPQLVVEPGHALAGHGEGLFVGAELVRNRETLAPATTEAHWIVNQMRQKGVLISTDGPLDNVLKIKPPMVFGAAEATLLLKALQQSLEALPG